MNLENHSFYSFFTKYSLMEEYGFTAGLFNRVFRKVLPMVPPRNTVDYILLTQEDAVEQVLAALPFEKLPESAIASELNASIQALCAKISAFGLDHQVKGKYHVLHANAAPFQRLLESLHCLDTCGPDYCQELRASLNAIDGLIRHLRKNKSKVGTTLHLTLTTRRILEYTERARELLQLKANLSSREQWEPLLRNHVAYLKRKNSIRTYVARHSDLLALEIVEHTSSKGEKYIAENRKEYRGFFLKALLGGGIIALFAFFKIIIDRYSFGPLTNALFFSLNYALCFVLVKQLGGIIATKQPAMTASTIAKYIKKQDHLPTDSIPSLVLLIRKVFRSQFVSIIGNFIMALSLACLALWVLQLLGVDKLVSAVKPAYLLKNVKPTFSLVFFASIAGFFLALSGLISGYIDNKLIVSRIPYRMQSALFFLKSPKLAAFIDKNAGVLVGNISLGFFLGSAFLLSSVLPFAVDIRHIAFSSANVGYAILSESFGWQTVALSLAGALLIGLVNFVVSFSITLYLALKSRGGRFALLPRLFIHSLKDFVLHPLYYFYKMEEAENPKDQ